MQGYSFMSGIKSCGTCLSDKSKHLSEHATHTTRHFSITLKLKKRMKFFFNFFFISVEEI